MDLNRVQVAGVLLLLAGIVFLIGLPMAESLYPGYSVNENFMSDLGATCRYAPAEPMPCAIQQPASAVFTASLLAMGLLVLAAAYLLLPLVRRWFVLFLGLFGVGVTGAALFSEVYYPTHGLFGVVAFVFGGLSAFGAFWIVRGWMRHLSLALGIFALAATAVDFTLGGYITGGGTELPIGMGGMERLNVYPTLLWLVALGAVLMASPELLRMRTGAAAADLGSAARPAA